MFMLELFDIAIQNMRNFSQHEKTCVNHCGIHSSTQSTFICISVRCVHHVSKQKSSKNDIYHCIHPDILERYDIQILQEHSYQLTFENFCNCTLLNGINEMSALLTSDIYSNRETGGQDFNWRLIPHSVICGTIDFFLCCVS